MSIPKKGCRKITVNGLVYYWLIRKKATYTQEVYGGGKLHVGIELADHSKSVLHLITDRPHSKNIDNTLLVAITPKDISIWISQAKELGWNPLENQSMFRIKIENNLMVKI